MTITLAGSNGYAVRTTRAARDIEAAQRLRYEIFNLELGEGLSQSFLSGLDADPFDARCDHLIVEDSTTGAVVGTYRLQTGEMAAAGIGYYSAGEFDFTPFEEIRPQCIELGRACIHQDHRKRSVLDILWRGIAGYARAHGARYLVGCSSLNSQDPADGWGLYHSLKDHHLAPLEMRTVPHAGFTLPPPPAIPENARPPRLFAAYLAIGAVIAGPPALDREFGTIDFLTLLDIERASAAGKKHFFHDRA